MQQLLQPGVFPPFDILDKIVNIVIFIILVYNLLARLGVKINTLEYDYKRGSRFTWRV